MAEEREPEAGEEGAVEGRVAPICAPGTLVDQFKILRPLGRGGMGEVYLAHDATLGRRVALKMVAPELLGSDEAVQRFVFEARTTAKLSHPHIVTVFAAGQHVGKPYVALEYLEGETLRDRMEERPPSVPEALRFVLGVSEGVSEAHSHGVLHRDLKPENVMIPLDGRVRVVDFGLAKRLDSTAVEALDTTVDADGGTRHGPGGTEIVEPSPNAAPRKTVGVQGTPAYMAPEQWLQQPCTGATDVWALGVMLFELLTGRHPFRCDSIKRLVIEVCGPQVASSVQDHAAEPVASELAELVARCLRKDALERPGADQVVQTLRRLLVDPAGRRGAGHAPFRGLLPFAEQHAELFFGREPEITAFAERLRLQPVLAVVGASGVGKSSFVQAGVIPRLAEQERWLVLHARPGAHPFRALAAQLLHRRGLSSFAPTEVSSDDHPSPPPSRGLVASDVPTGAATHALAEVDELVAALSDSPRKLSLELGRLADEHGAKVLLFVDQLEELFTLTESERTRRRFMEAICTAAADPVEPVRVVFAVRDDFLGRLAVGAEVREALSRVTVLQRLERSALTQILEQPLEVVGYRYDEPELVEQMVEDVAGTRAGLPLLQFAARTLWERRDEQRKLLLHSAYEAMGGVDGALAQHADGVLEGLSAAELELARVLLLRLVTPERTRRVVLRSEAVAGLGGASEAAAAGDASEPVERVLARLTDARLVIASRGRGSRGDAARSAPGGDGATLELVHESLIRTWRTLARWIEQSHGELVFLDELDKAAVLWDQRGQDPNELWRGAALAVAQREADGLAEPLSELAEQFLAAGHRRERRQARRRRFIRMVIAGTLGAIAVAAVIVALVIADKERQAVAERDRAEQREVAALRETARAAFEQGRPLEARATLRLALEGERIPTAATRALWWQLERDPLRWHRLAGAVVYAVQFSPDGGRLGAVDQAGTVRIFDVATGRVRVFRGYHDQLFGFAFSPDGRHFATGGWEGAVRVRSAESGAVERTAELDNQGVVWLSWSPDGSLIAVASRDGNVILWSHAASHQPPAVLQGHTATVTSVAFSPDGRWLASSARDGTVRLWDVAQRREQRQLVGHEEVVQAVAFSPDGRLLATASHDQSVRLWEVDTGREQRVFTGHQGLVRTVAFSPDGRTLGSGGFDDMVRLWDVQTGKPIGVRSHASAVVTLAFSPDGQRLASGTLAGGVRLFAARSGHAPPPLGGHTAPVAAVSFSPDGTQLASTGNDSLVRLWDTEEGELRRVFEGHDDAVMAVEFGPRGRWLASGGFDRMVRLWALRSADTNRVFAGHGDVIGSLSFAPDGRTLASASNTGKVQLWDLDTDSAHKKEIPGSTDGRHRVVTIAHDGQRLATGGSSNLLQLWDLRTLRPLGELRGHTGRIWDVDFSPDDRSLVTASSDRSIRLWDSATGSSRVLGEHSARAYTARFHPDGQRVASAGADRLVHLWDIPTGRRVSFRGHQDEINWLAFNPDGTLLATASDDETVRVWEVATGQPYWRGPVMLGSPPRLLSHRGWQSLGPQGASVPAGPPPNVGPNLRAALEEHARYAAMATGEGLCVQTHGGQLELWDRAADQLVAKATLAGIDQLFTLPQACTARAGGKAWLLGADAPELRELAVDGEVTAVGTSGARILVAAEQRIYELDGSGASVGSYQAHGGIVAVAGVELRNPPVGVGPDAGLSAAAPDRAGRFLVVGYRDGGVELWPATQNGDAPVLQLERAVASRPLRLLPGPLDTLLIGHANGLVGLWDLRDGGRLATGRLHGPVVHLWIEDQQLYAATALGSHLRWDLAPFYADECALLREVWERVPVIWRHGQAVRQPRPDDHRCRASE